jgi:uncharacterized membrane protein YjjP (DUF1212 family)
MGPNKLMSSSPTVPDALSVVAEAGALLLTSGAETARVEDTMERLALSFNAPAAAVVLPTMILLSRPDGRTLVRRIRRRTTNLGTVAAINQLSREAAAGHLSLQAFQDGLREAAHFRRYPAMIDLVAAGGAAALLSLLFSGAVPDLPWAFLAGALAQGMRSLARGIGLTGSLGDFMAALAASLPALAAAAVGVRHPGSIIVGGIMVLVPGLLMTTAVRDGIGGDLLTSAGRLLEAGLIAGAVASGAALPLYLYLQMGGRWP